MPEGSGEVGPGVWRSDDLCSGWRVDGLCRNRPDNLARAKYKAAVVAVMQAEAPAAETLTSTANAAGS